MYKRLCYAVPALLLLAGCANDEITERTDDRTPIVVESYVPGQTRVAVSNLNTLVQNGFQLVAQYENNGTSQVLFNEAFQADAEGHCSASSGDLVYWPSVAGANVEFLGIYPKAYAGSNITWTKNTDKQLEVSIGCDGSTDYIVAYLASQKTADGSITLNFKHVLAQITLKVNCDDAPMNYVLKSASIYGPARAVYNCSTGTITTVAGNENFASRAIHAASDNPIEVTQTLADVGGLMICASNDVENGSNCTLSLTYQATINGDMREYTRTADVKIVAGYENVVNATISGDRPLTVSAGVGNFQKEVLANGHEYVDLGLPSGLLWATCNVGASSPEEYGDYFAWGDTEPYYSVVGNDTIWKDGYSAGYVWDNYKFGTEANLAKYIGEGDILLSADDDAAHANWGGDWRMPTSGEWNELINCCKEVVWSDELGGYTFTSYNGNSIFLLAAGYRSGVGLYDTDNHYGYYWSSSLDDSTPHQAVRLFFHAYNVSTDWYSREQGYSVRAVIEPKSVNVAP